MQEQVDHVANLENLSQCHVPSVESQLRSKRLRWYGNLCRQADGILTQCMMFGQLKGSGHVGKPREIWNKVVLSDIYHVSVSCLRQVAQNKPTWQAQTCSTRT